MSSAVLQALKTVDERITENYTSGQLFEVLDKMLYRAIAPLIANTTYVDRSLSIVLAWYAQNHRRRISSHEKKRLTTYIVAFLASSDPDRRLALYRKMRLERSLTIFLVRHWLSLIEPWRGLHIRACRGEIPRAEEQTLMLQCCVQHPSALWGAIAESRYWLDCTLDFKHQIAEKYMRFVMMEAQGHWQGQRQSNPHLTLDLNELAQNFMLAVIKAIDKFDERQGTLTAYIQNWIKNAKITQVFRGEYGTAFSIPHSKKVSIAQSRDGTTRNLSVSLDSDEALSVVDDSSAEARIQQDQEHAKVRSVAKDSDQLGIGRLLLGIPEVLNEDELHLLYSAAIN